jgi:hypothetical protein
MEVAMSDVDARAGARTKLLETGTVGMGLEFAAANVPAAAATLHGGIA